MKIHRSLLGLAAVAGLAFAAGHLASENRQMAWAGGHDEKGREHQEAGDAAYEQAGMPGEHHRYLDPMIGDWEGTWKIWMQPGTEPMVSHGTVHREWILDGRYVKEVVEATSDWGTFKGVGFIGYDNVDGQYEVAWMDSMSTGIYTETGTYDPDKKILTTRGSHRDPATGQVRPTWGESDLSNPNRQTYLGYLTGPDGRSFKHFEGINERKR